MNCSLQPTVRKLNIAWLQKSPVRLIWCSWDDGTANKTNWGGDYSANDVHPPVSGEAINTIALYTGTGLANTRS
jgi:hypothetical protein